jgi:acetyl esterase/lipase
LQTLANGPEPENVGELRLPEGEGPFPVVVVIHGGYYREQWERDTAEPLAIGLAQRGYATWNIDYRRTGPGGDGGWPRTFDDIAAGIDHVVTLAGDHPLDLDRVVVGGHSAGGHFALWAGGRPALPADAPGGSPRVVPALALSLAGVVDLVVAAERGVGFGHNPISALMEAMPADDPQRYALASPSEMTISVPQVLIQGTGGDDPDLIDINRLYAARHPEATFVEIEGADHFDIT